MENELISTKKIEDLIDNHDIKGIRQLFELIPTIDISEACDDIEDTKKLVFIFKVVKSEYTADFFTELSPETKEKLIHVMSDAELATILDKQFTDDLVDDLEDLPANLVTRVLKNVSKERRATINRLLNYKDDSAGSIMTTEFLVLISTLTADEAISQIRKVGKAKETIYTLFIIDNKRNLVGTLDLDDLIFAKGDTPLTEIMNRDFVTVNVNTDQEEVANLIKRYDLNAIAVLNNEQRLVGLITVDDIVDVIEQEANEDVQSLSHVAPLDDSYLDTSVFQMAKKCVPWIVILLVLGTFSSMVLSIFQDKLAIVPVLAAFIPVLMDTGGNAGGQTIALMIRGLATKEFEPKDFWKILGKEVLSALLISACVAVFAFIWFTFEQYAGIVSLGDLSAVEGDNAIFNFTNVNIWHGNCWTLEFAEVALKVSFIVAGTLFLTTFISKIVAVMLPIGVAAIKKDPAVVAQPLLTTIVDVVSLLTYFGIASLAFSSWLL